MPSYDEHDAWNKVKRKKGFYKHASAYLGVGIGLFFLNLVTSPGDWWFQYSMASWGVGLAVHYFSVFGIPSIGALDDEWEQKEYEKEIERKQRLQGDYSSSDYLDLEEVMDKHKSWRDSDLV